MGNFMVGGKVSGNDEGAYEVQEAAAYRYKSCVVSASCCEKHTVLNTALFAAPYKNVLCKIYKVDDPNAAMEDPAGYVPRDDRGPNSWPDAGEKSPYIYENIHPGE